MLDTMSSEQSAVALLVLTFSLKTTFLTTRKSGSGMLAIRASYATSRALFPLTCTRAELFDLNLDVLGGQVDTVLDRAALVALSPSLIEDQYLPLIASLMVVNGKVLFASVSELPFPKAPPHIYEDKMIEGLLQGFFANIEKKEVLPYRYRVNAGHVSEPI